MMSPGVTRPLLAPIRSRLSALRRGTWMPTERLVMRHVRDVMRLKAAGMPSREIARRVGAAPSTVRLTIRRFEASGLTWPLPDDVTDTVLEARLFAKAGSGGRQGQRRLTEPDWAVVHRELKRKHVTLSIVWEEYIAGEPGGYRYSRFCELYRAWEGRLSVTMRQSHAAGDKLFVDYAGDGVPVVIDRLTGERRAAQIFVAVLGASSFTYAQATWTQGLADWISGHVGAFEAIGGVPALLVPDNTKVAVIKACLYDPQINRSYAEVNAAIAEMLIRLNEERPIRRLGVTRRKLLEEIDRPALKALPESPYVFAEWRICRVSIDYHVEVEAHYYSVPHRFVRAEVEVRFTARTVEIFHKGERIAAHQRMSGNHKHTTVPEHMASSHRRYAGWTIERIRKDAAMIGPATAALRERVEKTSTYAN